MRKKNIADQIKAVLEPKESLIQARLFVTRDDGITVYDSVQDNTSASVAALVSGVWQAAEALMGMVQQGQDVMEFRFGFDTSSQGIFLFPFAISDKKYFLGAIYHDCLNPGQLKRQVIMLKEELSIFGQSEVVSEKKKIEKSENRAGFLFKDITDEEIDRLFSLGGL